MLLWLGIGELEFGNGHSGWNEGKNVKHFVFNW
jgi:hypothetical protein